ncbi:MAG: sodium:solute symporter [Verrucomicrobiae bacterium]|nr:sodium:solute symporter [Verrucomicrobiae bacterium]
MPSSSYFGTADYVFMGLYVLVLIFLGFYLKRLASRSLDNYICGGKNIPWWAMGISGMASFLDLAGTAVIVSFLFLLGPQGLFVEFRGGAVLVLPFMMLWTGKWHRRSGCLTGAQWNIYRFGDCWGGRASQLMGVIATVLTTIGMLAYLIIGAGIFLSTFLPFSPEACSLTLLVMATLYTMMSGFYGVIFTDLFQVCIILIAVVYITFKAFTGVGDVGEIRDIAATVTGNPDWISGVPKWNVHVPDGYQVYKHLIVFASFYLVRTIVAGLGTGADPRYFGARNDRECGKLSMLWTVLMTVRWPMMIGIAVMGLYLVNDLLPEQAKLKDAAALIHEAHPETTKPQWGALISSIANAPDKQDPALVGSLKSLLGEEKWSEKMNLLSYEGTVNPEKILSAVLMMSVAEGMRGVLVIALIAAALSTFGSWVNLATGQFVNDFYHKWIRPQAQTRELIFASWGTVVGIVACSYLFSLTLESINDIWGWMMMGFGAGFLVPSFLRLYWWRFNGAGSAIGTLVGIAAAIVQRLVWPELNEVWQFVFVLGVGFVSSIVAALLTAPTDPEVLRKMYLETRPFGVWGHLKETLSPEERAKTSREHRQDLTALPFALVWQTCLFLAPMLFIIHNWKGFAGTAAICAGSFAAIWLLWFRHQPKGNFYD